MDYKMYFVIYVFFYEILVFFCDFINRNVIMRGSVWKVI